MSQLQLFRAESTASRDFRIADEEVPVILAFRSLAGRSSLLNRQPSVTRAKTMRDNDRCPQCACADIEPLQLSDASIGRNNRPIPGTATLVGFHCRRCQCEWPATTRDVSFS